MFWYLLYTAFLIVGSYALAIFFGVATMRRLRRDTAAHSERTRALQRVFNRIMVLQVSCWLILKLLL